MIIHVRGDVIEIRGSLVENHWLALKSAVSLLLEQYPNGVIIDGSRLTDINEAGAHTFLDASNYIQAQNARVVISGLSDRILEEIRGIPGARSQLPLVASVEEARASLAVGGAEAVPEARRKPAVLVPLLGAWKKAVEFAAIEAAKKAEIHLLYAIEVPRTLPLGEPLPEKEREATQALAEGERVISGYGLAVRKLTTRSRVALEGVGKFISEAGPRLAVIAYPKDELVKDIGPHDVVGVLCQEAPCDVAILCAAEPVEGRSAPAAGRPVVLVPLVGVWPRAVEFAAVQAAARKAEVHLLYVIEVPRTLPLDAALPDKEEEAQQALMEAERALKHKGVAVRKSTVRARDMLEGAAKFAAEMKPELLAAAYFKEELANEITRYDVMSKLCHETPCDVVVYCVTA